MTRKARPEAILERHTLFALGSDPRLAIFKNECGEGFYANVREQIRNCLDGEVRRELVAEVLAILDRNRVHYGLHVGSADLIGVVAVEVTPEMVGSTIGRFVSIELKSASGALRTEQEVWRDRMRELGAVAEVARTPGDAALAVEKARRR